MVSSLPVGKARFSFVKSTPFLAVHIVALVGAWIYPPTWTLVGVAAASYFVRMFAITAGYHRYFSHKSYKVNRFVQFCLAWIGASSVQKGPLWWAANHRHHHRYSDQPQDIHSPVQSGFWWSHMGWVLSDAYDETRWELIPDLKKYPELVWLNRFHVVPVVALGLLMLALGGASFVIWGLFISTVLLFHGTATINSLSHVFGSRRYHTTDDSRNNFWLALITLGEGWHNNHHTYMVSARQGFYWWEIDISYYTLTVLSWLGVVRELKQPPLDKLAQLEIRRAEPVAA